MLGKYFGMCLCVGLVGILNYWNDYEVLVNCVYLI